MEVDGIDHIEFYVGDVAQSTFYLTTGLGFDVVGRGNPALNRDRQVSQVLRQGGIDLMLTSGLVPDHPATQYVNRHGDGVACIALGTPDARAAFEASVGSGAEPLQEPTEYGPAGNRVIVAEVAGFGDVRHRFVQRASGTSAFWPGVIDGVSGSQVITDPLLTTIDHVAICLPPNTLDETVSYYEKAFGFRRIFEEYVEVGEQAMNSKVVQSLSERVTFTLLEPDTNRSPGQVDRFVSAHGGAGVQHLAMLTDDIIGAVKTLESRGVRFLPTVSSYYNAIQERLGDVDLSVDELRDANVLVDRDHWGELFQIFTYSMHARDTYFVEVIDRHGAKTFGSGNIKALYEAVRGAETANSSSMPAESKVG